MSDALLATVTDEAELVASFAAVLQEESAALAEGALAPLPTLVERKNQLVERIARMGQQRDQQLGAMGFGAGRAGMNQAVAADPRLAEPWKNVLSKAHHARAANHTNGLMINTRMDYNRRALLALQRAAGLNPTYGPDGRLPGFASVMGR
jgi:flagella synthesis protein FlgN